MNIRGVGSQNCWPLAFRPGSAGVLDSVRNYPHIVWSHAKPGCSVVQCGRMPGTPKIYGCWCPTHLRCGDKVDPKTCLFSRWANMPTEFGCCCRRCEHVSSRSVQIIGTSGPPFKVTKITERYAVRADTRDFLLVIVIVIVISKNCGPMSYRFRDKRRYWTKTAHFPILCI